MTLISRLRIPAATLFLLVWTAAWPAHATVPLENVAARPHGASPSVTLEQIRASITRAASERGWSLVESAPERVRVSIVVRDRHEATVDVRFDAETFSIGYVDSINLDYSSTGVPPEKRSQKSTLRRLTTEQTFDLGPRIHPNYNKWVARLADQIERRIAEARPIVPAASTPGTSETAGSTTQTAEPPVLVADELEKLDALRERGVLTEAEFQAQKAKLLGR